MYLIFDTETTGLPKHWDAPITDLDNWPRAVQIAWQLHDDKGKLIAQKDFLIKIKEFTIPFDAEQIHGISTELALQKGTALSSVLDTFLTDLSASKFIVGHNLDFDIKIMASELYRLGIKNRLQEIPVLDTCTEQIASICKLSGGRGGRYKLPTLSELYKYLFNASFDEAHNAVADVMATSRCFFELVRIRQGFAEHIFDIPNYFQIFREANPNQIEPLRLSFINLKKASEHIRQSLKKEAKKYTVSSELQKKLQEAPFVHLHNHTRFSVLQSTIDISKLVEATAAHNMPAVAITDTSNMMGVFQFIEKIKAYNLSKEGQNSPIKPVVGCQLYVCENHLDKSRKDNGHQIVFLAKNEIGYHNLAKMSSIAYSKGFYYVPRIDREIVKSYKEDLIVLTGDINGEVPAKILNVGIHQAEDALLWWKSEFGEDLYIEVADHGIEVEQRLNKTLVELSEKHQVKIIATNTTYYINEGDAEDHDILLCIKAGEKQSTPIGKGRGYRYGMENKTYYFRSTKEMKELFAELPQAIINISEVLSKIEFFDLKREVLLPKFGLPKSFQGKKEEDKEGENRYLRHLTYEGVKNRYPELTEKISSRIDFELEVIKNTGYPGYFLIVQDFISEARRMGIFVGPGRGSAAGSVVAYCLGIVNIDPMEYNLLFERFLNPDRVSMPDIDIDFDDEGRDKVIDYVRQKYGNSQVAQIITYGTLAGRSAIKDTARVLDLPLNEAERLAKLIPFGTNLYDIFEKSQDLKKLRPDEISMIEEIKSVSKTSSLEAQILRQARHIEGALRHTGVHACGIIITPDNIINHVPLTTNKDSDLYVTQFDNSVVEEAGLLKMDFLGLKTLTIIKDAIQLIKKRRSTVLSPDTFPLDDEKTYQLFQRGDTTGLFQFESVKMQEHMQTLRPTVFGDLIAMNALYRPGPMKYIPSFIHRKHGEEPITYDLEACEEYLKETYGITVYQEQVMLLAQKLANFTRGEADLLRKAMGKKIASLLDKLKPKFIAGGSTNNYPIEVLEKIWKDWEAFAEYAFNKSHATCYALIGYQTAYLKANYPEEYMASLLSNNMNDIKKASFLLKECQRMNIPVLPADINESFYNFTVNKNNAIRLGMGAVKGVGKGAVETIVNNREKEGGEYSSIFDFVRRINLRAANKKSLESLVYAGAFDCFKTTHRAQYLNKDDSGLNYIEKSIRFGSEYQTIQKSSQLSLFEGGDAQNLIPEPVIPDCPKWNTIQKLEYEKEVIGIYISGHPLDEFREVFDHFCKGDVSNFKKENIKENIGKQFSIAGVVLDVQHLTSRNGKKWGKFTLGDYNDSHEFLIFGEDYLRFKHFLNKDVFLYIDLKVKKGWLNKNTGGENPPRVEFYNMKLLQNVMEEEVKKITIHCETKIIDKSFIGDLERLVNQSRGEVTLHFVLKDTSSKILVNMSSKTHKVKISQELLAELGALEVLYKLN